MSRNKRKRNFKHTVELEVCGEYVAGKGIRLTPGKVKSGRDDAGSLTESSRTVDGNVVGSVLVISGDLGCLRGRVEA
jgi:hypothetical protein